MTPDPAMPKAMQITSLKRIFTGLNPGVGVDLIDWIAHVEEALTLPENRLELSIEYPQHRWFTDEEEMKTVKREALKETEELLDYMLSAVPKEMRSDYKDVFDGYLSMKRFKLERGISSAKDKRLIVALQRQLEESNRERSKLERILQEQKRQPKPPAWTTRLERKLEDIFKATFTRAGLSPTRFMSEYRTELETIKTLPTEDDLVSAVEAFAAEIVQRELARKIKPPRVRDERPPERPPRDVRVGLPEEEEEEEFYVEAPPAEFPTYPEKGFFPSRRLTTLELIEIENKYYQDVYGCGKNPDLYRQEYEDWIETFLFDSWDQVKKNYESLIDIVCYGKKIKLLPRALPAEVIDELVHWLVSLKKYNTIEEIQEQLELMGKTATKENIILAIRTGYKQKVPSFVIVTRDYLEKLLGEPLT